MTTSELRHGEAGEPDPERARAPGNGPPRDRPDPTAAHWRALLDIAAEGVVGADVGGRCIYVNRRAQELLGYAEDDCLGRDLHGLLHGTRTDGPPCPLDE